MSTLLLYHAFGLKGIHCLSIQYLADSGIFNAAINEAFIRCPKCGHRKVTNHHATSALALSVLFLIQNGADHLGSLPKTERFHDHCPNTEVFSRSFADRLAIAGTEHNGDVGADSQHLPR
jgi:hypothetical protein